MHRQVSNAALEAFAEFCDSLEHTEMADLTDCQYWVFERGYQAAMERLQHQPVRKLGLVSTQKSA